MIKRCLHHKQTCLQVIKSQIEHIGRQSYNGNWQDVLQFYTLFTGYIPDFSNDREIQDLAFHNKNSQIRSL